MQSPASANHFNPWTQPKMICVSQNYARIQIVLQGFKAHALDGSRGAHRHEDRRLNGSAASGKNPSPGVSILGSYLKVDWRFVWAAIGPIRHIGPTLSYLLLFRGFLCF